MHIDQMLAEWTGAAWSEWDHSIACADCAIFHRKKGCQKRREGGV